MRPNTYNPDCDFDPDQRDLDASIEERNKTEPDATERARAWVQKQTGRFELDNPLLEADIADLAAFLESEAPRIRADERKKAVREFVTRFKKNVGYLSHPVNVKLMIDRTVKEMMVEQMIKEMTEVD